MTPVLLHGNGEVKNHVFIIEDLSNSQDVLEYSYLVERKTSNKGLISDSAPSVQFDKRIANLISRLSFFSI